MVLTVEQNVFCGFITATNKTEDTYIKFLFNDDGSFHLRALLEEQYQFYELDYQIPASYFLQTNSKLDLFNEVIIDTQDALFCKYEKQLLKLVYIKESKAVAYLLQQSILLEFLATIHKDVLTFKTPCYQCKFLNNPIEKQKILQARVLLLIQINNPPSLSQLAKSINMNECYLKKGFKEIFQCTIFEFVQKEKIKKAQQLLLLRKYTVQEIAYELGYSNQANFATSYKKNTGLTPSEWLLQLN